MQKRERFFPEFNHILCGKPPKTAFTQFKERLDKLRQSTLSERSLVFGDLVPINVLAPMRKGKHSRVRVYSKNVTFWGFLHQALSPSTPCREDCA